MHMLTLFSIKTNLRENRFFAARWRLVDEKGTHNVKFLAKNQTKQIYSRHARVGNETKRCRLATASASGCRACCSRTTRTASWKGRSNRPLTGSFLLVETALNNFLLITLWDIATFCHRQMGQNFGFHRIFVQYFVHGRDVYLGITSQRHKLRSICRNTKSQHNFNMSTSWQVGGRSHLLPFRS